MSIFFVLIEALITLCVQVIRGCAIGLGICCVYQQYLKSEQTDLPKICNNVTSSHSASN